MIRRWLFLENPILNATDNSFRMAIRISTWHDSALKAANADPFILALYVIYHPLHLALVAAYDAFTAKEGTTQGETLNLRELFRLEANSKINAWDAAIQVVYAKGSVPYMSLLPNGHGPFQTGTQTQRINAVQTLSNSIGTDAALAAVKADVDTFYGLLNTANSTQKGSISTINALSDAVDAARINMSVAQYADLGKLIGAHAADTTVIDQYFDLEALRKGQQVLFTGQVKKNDVHTIVKHTFAATDMLDLENPGVTELQFYLAAVKGAHPGATIITLAAGTQQTVPASALGDVANTYLMVFNPDLINKGQFVVELV